MRTINRFLVAVTALLLAGAVPALAQKHYRDVTTPPLPAFDVPEAERVELPNGMVVFLIEDHELPLVNMSARVGVGSVYEPAEKVGLAALTGEVMRTGGSKAMDGDAMNEMLESIGAVIETYVGETNGIAYASALKETFDDVLPVFVEVLTEPAFPEDKLELAKMQQKSGISRRNDDPQEIAFREFGKMLYGEESPYARHPEYATIDAITRDDLAGFHARFFHPNNVILGVWGDFDAQEMAGKIEAAFRHWPRKPDFVRPEPPPVPAAQDAAVYFAPKPDVTQSTVVMGHPGEIRLDHPDYFAVTVMNQVLSGGFASRLFNKVRTEQGLAYAVFGAYTANFDRPGEFYAGTMTKSESTVEAAQSIQREIARLREEPPAEAELALAKDSYLNSFVFNFDTRQEIVNRMMTYEHYGYPLDYLNRIREGIQAVDRDDVQRVAQQYLRPEKVKILVVGNEADFGAPLSTLGPVHTLDLTIPTGEAPAPEATGETLAEGRRLLQEAVAALGGIAAFEAIRSAHLTSSTSLTTPDNMQMRIGTDAVVDYVQNRMHAVQTLPVGQIEVVLNGGLAVVQTPQGPQSPPGLAQELMGHRWRDLVHLFRSTGSVGVQYLGREDVEGRPVDVLLIETPGDVTDYRLYLDAETKEPVAMSYQGQNMMTRATVQARDLLSDYRSVGAIRVPFKVTTYQDGRLTAETVTDAIELNVPLDDARFDAGQ